MPLLHLPVTPAHNPTPYPVPICPTSPDLSHPKLPHPLHPAPFHPHQRLSQLPESGHLWLREEVSEDKYPWPRVDHLHLDWSEDEPRLPSVGEVEAEQPVVVLGRLEGRGGEGRGGRRGGEGKGGGRGGGGEGVYTLLATHTRECTNITTVLEWCL